MSWKVDRASKEDARVHRTGLCASKACQQWPCFPLSHHCLLLAEVKMRHKRPVWQLMNNTNLLWIRKGGCAQQPRKCSCLSRTLAISGVPNISPFASSQLDFFSFLVHNIFVNIVLSFSLNFLLSLLILFAPLHLASSSTLLMPTQSSPVLCKTQQSHSL